MITKHQRIKETLSYSIEEPYSLEEILFFDIETTGFSPNTSFLYLIGCMYYKDNSWQLIQWLSDGIDSEKLIIEAFLSMLQGYKKIIHYNGTGFDIPYLLSKLKHYGLINPFLKIESYDIYKKLLPHKKLLALNSLKLGDIQNYVEFKRKDTYSGGDLITVYTNFIGRLQYEKLKLKNSSNSVNTIASSNTSSPTAEELSNILFLHNAEDIEGLLLVASLLKYVDFIENRPIDKEIQISLMKDNYLKLQSKLPYYMDKPINYILPLHIYWNQKNMTINHPYYNLSINVSISNNRLNLYLPFIHGELKYFYKDYKDYYYLPAEDIAIHKSVAEYVDKEYRKKAKANTCYNKKFGFFIPFFQNKTDDTIFKEDFSFYINYGDKIMFYPIDLSEETVTLLESNNINWYDYMLHLLTIMFQNKSIAINNLKPHI